MKLRFDLPFPPPLELLFEVPLLDADELEKMPKLLLKKHRI
jgi:hypothetical protein